MDKDELTQALDLGKLRRQG